MGRARQNGAITYDLVVDQKEFEALEARAQEQGTSIAEVVRADLLSPDNKERLVPRARKLIRHATINVHPRTPEMANKMESPTLEPGLD